MKKSVYTTFIAGCLVAGAALFGFQNCAGPEGAHLGSSSASTSNGTNGVPGSANNTTDLANTGVSAVTTPAAPVAPAGSVASSVYVTILYQGLVQRSPTAAELTTWAQYIGLGYGCSFIAQQVLGSSEYVTLVPNLAVATITLDLTKGLLNRSPSPAEQSQAAALAAQYPNRAQAAGVAAANIIGTAEFKTYCSQYKNLTP